MNDLNYLVGISIQKFLITTRSDNAVGTVKGEAMESSFWLLHSSGWRSGKTDPRMGKRKMNEGREKMLKEQLSFLDDVDEKAVRKIVIKELKNLPRAQRPIKE